MRCQKIVLKLLSFARKHPIEKKDQDLNECVAKVLDLKAYHLKVTQIETNLELDEHLPRTCFDYHQIEQVVLNLLNNAEHAIGSIKRPGKITLRTGVDAGGVFVEIEDDGPGVPAAVKDRIFDPFFTTKGVGAGTGLGLSVSFGIVNEHGGRIELRQASGDGGAIFHVWLPVVAAESVQARPVQTEVQISSNTLEGCRILIAEDEPVVLDVMARVLQTEGAVVTLARDGEEAWELLNEQEFDLIVADLRMPKVTGQELYERAVTERPDLLRRFVFATGDLAREETVAFLEQVPNRFVAKPLVAETVRQVLTQARGGKPE